MKDQAFFTSKLLDRCFIKKPPILAKLFGRKWVGIYGSTMVYGIKYGEIIYVLGQETSPSPHFQLPKGYKHKHILRNSY